MTPLDVSGNSALILGNGIVWHNTDRNDELAALYPDDDSSLAATYSGMESLDLRGMGKVSFS